MNTPKHASPAWLRRYAQPRKPDGTFAPGYFLWTRPDGESRWVYYPPVEDGLDAEYRWLINLAATSLLQTLALLVLIGFLVFVVMPR